MLLKKKIKQIRQQLIEEMLPKVKVLFDEYNFPITAVDDIEKFLALTLPSSSQLLFGDTNKNSVKKLKIDLELVEMSIALKNMANGWNEFFSMSAKDQFGNKFTIKEKGTIDVLYRFVKMGSADHFYGEKDHSVEEDELDNLRKAIKNSLKDETYHHANDFMCGSIAVQMIEYLEEVGIFNALKNKEKTGTAKGQNKEYAFIYDLFVIAKKIPNCNTVDDNMSKRDIIRSFISKYNSHIEDYNRILFRMS